MNRPAARLAFLKLRVALDEVRYTAAVAPGVLLLECELEFKLRNASVQVEAV